jgi:hypothetical protein
MSTQFDTQNTHNDDTYGYGQPAAGRRAPRQGGNRPSWYRIAAIVIGTVIVGALIVLAAVGLTHTTSTSTPAPAASTSAPAANPAQPTTPAQTVNPAQPTTPASPAVTPSASVKKLQQELGQPAEPQTRGPPSPSTLYGKAQQCCSGSLQGTSDDLSGLSVRHVDKARIVALKCDRHSGGRAIPVLGHD